MLLYGGLSARLHRHSPEFTGAARRSPATTAPHPRTPREFRAGAGANRVPEAMVELLSESGNISHQLVIFP
jgi:hypothetical protein